MNEFEQLEDLGHWIDWYSADIIETELHSLDFDYTLACSEYNRYLEQALLLSSQIRPKYTSEVDAFWRDRGRKWVADTYK